MTNRKRCDVCGKEIGYSTTVIISAHVYGGNFDHSIPYEYAKSDILQADLEKRSDLCYACSDAMMKFLNGRRKELP